MNIPGRSRIGAFSTAFAAVAVVLMAAGCDETPPGVPPAATSMQLLPAKAVAADPATSGSPSPRLLIPKIEHFEIKEEQAKPEYSLVALAYKDGKGRDAATLKVLIPYGEPDQTLDEKFKTMVDEAKVSIKDPASYQDLGAPQEFQMVDGIPGQLRVYSYLDDKGTKMTQALALLDMRKKDAV